MVRCESCADDSILKIKEILAHREIKRVPAGPDLMAYGPSPTRAGVLIPLFCKDGSYHCLFTRRTNTVKRHKGEISFPGGIYDATDADMVATALREAHEEIGLQPQDVELLGALDEIMTMSHFIISPFVGLIPYPYSFIPSHEEIDEIIILPLAGFLKEGVLSEEYRTYQGRTEKVTLYHSGGYVIWGATAKILQQFVDLIAAGGIIK
jgi:8-oxo-dGTP pyrophosphatase MutT (NUDIX family)